MMSNMSGIKSHARSGRRVLGVVAVKLNTISQFRAGARRSLRSGLLGSAAALILLGVSVPLSLDDASGLPELKVAQAKGGGGGGGNGGGNGGGGGNGHGGGKGSVSTLDGDGDDDGNGGKNGLGKLNATNGAMNSAGSASPNSTAGQIYDYFLSFFGGSTEDEAIEGGALAIEGGMTEADAMAYLSGFANKDVTAEIVEAVNLQLGLTLPDDDSSASGDEEAAEGDGEGDGTTTDGDG